MTFLIIEKFKEDKVNALYLRLEEKGRLLSPGIQYVNSWIDMDITTCYQIMKAKSIGQVQEWLFQWQEFADFEIIPVMDSDIARKIVLSENS